jgi:DNA primase
VAVPVTWDELKKIESGARFSMGDMTARLQKDCPAARVQSELQSLNADVIEALQDWSEQVDEGAGSEPD